MDGGHQLYTRVRRTNTRSPTRDDICSFEADKTLHTKLECGFGVRDRMAWMLLIVLRLYIDKCDRVAVRDEVLANVPF